MARGCALVIGQHERYASGGTAIQVTRQVDALTVASNDASGR